MLPEVVWKLKKKRQARAKAARAKASRRDKSREERKASPQQSQGKLKRGSKSPVEGEEARSKGGETKDQDRVSKAAKEQKLGNQEHANHKQLAQFTFFLRSLHWRTRLGR